MMKKLHFLIWLLVLLLAGCGGKAEVREEAIQPFLFYYRTASTVYGSEYGLICPEERDLGARTYTPEELIALYLEGPQRADLISPVPSGTKLLGVSRLGSQLMISLQQSYSTESGIDRSILDVCLVKTALQIEGTRQVRIHVESLGGQVLRNIVLSDSDILLYDSGENWEQKELTLYFADTNYRFLLTEKRTVPNMPAAELPEYVINQLIEGPENTGMASVLPLGTDLLDISVDNGVCSVDFNADFFRNRPTTQQREQLVLLSVVNSLCELDDITQVQFYVEGRRVDIYSCIDLTGSFIMDSSVVGPVRSELNEFEGTICLPGQNDGLLHSLTVRVRNRGNLSTEEALLHALSNRLSMNGLQNPLEGLALPLSVRTDGKTCTLDYPAGTFTSLDADTRVLALRSVTATLSSVRGVLQVRFLENGEPIDSEPMTSDPDWYCAQIR